MQENEKTLKTAVPSQEQQDYNGEAKGDKSSPQPAVEIKSPRKTFCSNLTACFRRLVEKHPRATILCSRIGIFLFLVLFNVFGAQVFVWLEQNNEVQNYEEAKQKLSEAKENITTLLLNSAGNLTLEQITEALSNYDESLAVSLDNGVDLNLNSTQEIKWSLLQSIFFASTILTTVGYGHIAPATTWGKAFCITFALIGIPLTLVVLSDIGEAIAKIVSFCEKKLKEGKVSYADLQEKKRKKSRWRRLFKAGKKVCFVFLALFALFCYLAIGSVFFMFSEGWNFLDSFYFCFITVTTVGFGDFVPAQTTYMLACTAYILVGLALTSSVIEMIRLRFIESLNRLKQSVNQLLDLSNQMGSLVRKVRDQVLYGDGKVDFKLIDEMMKVQRQIDQVQVDNGAKHVDSIFDLPAQMLLGPQLSPSFWSLHSTDLEEYDNVEILQHPPPLEWERDWEELWVRLESGEKVSYRLMKLAKDYAKQQNDSAKHQNK